MAEATQTSDQIQQVMNRTDFGHMIYENRKLLMTLLVAILFGVTGYFLWKQSQHSSALRQAEEVFQFQSTTWADAKADKIGPEALAQSFNLLPQAVREAPVMAPTVLEMSEILTEKGATAEAEAILNGASGAKGLGGIFISMQRAVVLEKVGKVDEAISVLEGLSRQKDLPVAQKVSLELGRLYMNKGEKGKAQTQFEDVVGRNPNDEFAKVAKLYLSQLAQ